MEAAASYSWLPNPASFFQNNGFVVQIFGRASALESALPWDKLIRILLSKELTGKSINFTILDPKRLSIDSEDRFSQANAVRH